MTEPSPLHQLSEAEQQLIALQKTAKEHTIEDCKVVNTSANGNLGEYFRIEMTIKEKDGEPEKHHFFMKALPLEPWKTDFLVKEGVFQKEVNFYRDVSRLLRKYLSTEMCPQCFIAEPGKIVMADASTDGYRLWRGITKEPLDYDHTKQGLLALARLHAGSLIHEEKTGRKVGDDFPDAAREVNYQPKTIGLRFLTTGAEAIAALAPHLDSDLGRDPEAVALLQKHVVPWMEKLVYYMNEDFPDRKVICHGDTWAANFLYKYDDYGKPISAIMVDFQLTRLRSPAVDVNMFLYLTATTDDVKKWREGLLDDYYQVMREEMAKCGLDSDKIYPKEEFLQACIRYQIVGLIFTMLYFPFSQIPLAEKNEATSTNEKANAFYFKDRSQNLIKWYKQYPLVRSSLDGIMDLFYHNFVKTQRGLTEFIS